MIARTSPRRTCGWPPTGLRTPRYRLPGVHPARASLGWRSGRRPWDGMRFVVPVPSVYARPNPKYFGRRGGATRLNMIQAAVLHPMQHTVRTVKAGYGRWRRG